MWRQFDSGLLDEHTEELLSIHEEEIMRLKDERRMKAPLLAAIKKYFEICEEEKELAAAASDQSRLLGRGPRDPGRLLREEKMRKRVNKEKPRVRITSTSEIIAYRDMSNAAGTRSPRFPSCVGRRSRSSVPRPWREHVETIG